MKSSPDPLHHVCYDLTRLVERMSARHQTGVDRVDLQYALWTRATAALWEGVVQTSRGVCMLEDVYVEQLLARLQARWLEGGSSGGSGGTLAPPVGWSADSLRAVSEKLARCSLGVVYRERGLGPALLRVLPGCLLGRVPVVGRPLASSSGKTAVYWNIGHCFRFEVCLAELLRLFGGRSVIFLQDIIPLTHPETQRATSRAHFSRWYAWVARFGGRVLVSSEATVQRIRDFEAGGGSTVPRLAPLLVAPLAVESRFFEGPPSVISGEPYFLCLGTREPRKNLDLLLDVWESLGRGGSASPRLVLIGKHGWSDTRQGARIHDLMTKGLIESPGAVDDAELIRWMAGACALLFPSLEEGWGLPLSEALTIGVPVIASDIVVFREVGQGVPDLLPPRAVDQWAACIRDYAAGEASLARRAQVERLRGYRPLSWAAHFEALKLKLQAP